MSNTTYCDECGIETRAKNTMGRDGAPLCGACKKDQQWRDRVSNERDSVEPCCGERLEIEDDGIVHCYVCGSYYSTDDGAPCQRDGRPIEQPAQVAVEATEQPKEEETTTVLKSCGNCEGEGVLREECDCEHLPSDSYGDEADCEDCGGEGHVLTDCPCCQGEGTIAVEAPASVIQAERVEDNTVTAKEEFGRVVLGWNKRPVKIFPDSLAWIDGILSVQTLDPEHGVLGWHAIEEVDKEFMISSTALTKAEIVSV